MTPRPSPRDDRGFTLIELVIVTAIIGILAAAVLPLARWSVKRSQEHQLQQNLRIIRNAIDRYRDAAAAGVIEVPEGGTGFPESLDVLVEGVEMIAEMPVPVPPVGGAYDATGPGLTGGLAGLSQQQAAAAGATGGLPGGAQGGAGRGAAGLAGSGNSNTVFSGARGGTGGLQLGGGRSQGAAAGTGTRNGPGTQSLFTPQGGQSGARTGASRGGFGTFGTAAGGGADAPPEPLLGPDGKPLLLTLLRRLPVDPVTGKADWGLRCYGEPPTDRLWCGKDVFDVYSKSPARAIDGTYYKDW